MQRVALFLFCLAVTFGPASAAQEGQDKKPAKVDVTGKWKAKVEFGGQAGEPTFTLKQDGDRTTSKYEGSFGEHDVTGKVTGDKVEFGFDLDQGEVIYTGTIDKDAMKGEAKYGDLAGTWTAEREAAKPKAASINAPATTIERTTFPYVTKGSQTLHLDRIVDPAGKVAGRRPVIIFSVGGG